MMYVLGLQTLFYFLSISPALTWYNRNALELLVKGMENQSSRTVCPFNTHVLTPSLEHAGTPMLFLQAIPSSMACLLLILSTDAEFFHNS